MWNQLQRFFKEEEGQSTVEYMLLISVVVIAIVAAAYVFLEPFQDGVSELGEDVKGGLNSGQIAGAGTKRSWSGQLIMDRQWSVAVRTHSSEEAKKRIGKEACVRLPSSVVEPSHSLHQVWPARPSRESFISVTGFRHS